MAAYTKQDLLEYTLRLGDSNLVLGQRLAEWCGHAPLLEEELALMNIGLDLIGQARMFLTYAGEVEGDGRDEDRLAYFRDAQDWRNCLLVEQPNGNFADTIARQFLFDTFQYVQLDVLRSSTDKTLGEIAVKSLKEVTYHVRYSRNWLLRLGDGTDESHQKMQQAVDDLWGYVPELFEMVEGDRRLLAAGVAVDMENLQSDWEQMVENALAEATLSKPEKSWAVYGSREGKHSEHLGYLLAEMQFLPRAYPDAQW